MSTVNYLPKNSGVSTDERKFFLYKVSNESQQKESINHSEINKAKIAFKTSNGIHVVDKNDIVRCESASNYCKIYFSDGSNLLISKTLKSVQKLLSNVLFARIHTSHLISIMSIKHIDIDEVELIGGEKIPISKLRRKDFMMLVQDQFSLC